MTDKIFVIFSCSYLASGDLLSSMAMLYRIGRSTATCIIRETCEAIWIVLSPKELFQPSEKGWLEIANDFENRWNFPHCIGAIDGKHVVIQVIFNKEIVIKKLL